MRTTVPSAFEMTFSGADGLYVIRFQPVDEWDGTIDVTIRGLELHWHVVNAEREEGGGIVLGGMTTGTEPLWEGRQFWFALRLDDAPPVIQYWGNRVIWRVDRAI